MLTKEDKEILDNLSTPAKAALSNVVEKFLTEKNEIKVKCFIVSMNMDREHQGPHSDEDLLTLSQALISNPNGSQDFIPPKHSNPSLFPSISKEAAKIYLTDWHSRINEEKPALLSAPSARGNYDQTSLGNLSAVGEDETKNLQAALYESLRDDWLRREPLRTSNEQFEADNALAIAASHMEIAPNVVSVGEEASALELPTEHRVDITGDLSDDDSVPELI